MYIPLNCDINCSCRYQDLDNKYFVKSNPDLVHLESATCLVLSAHPESWFKHSLINALFGHVVTSFVSTFFLLNIVYTCSIFCCSF